MQLEMTKDEVDLLIHAASLGVQQLESSDKAEVRILLQRIKEELKEQQDEEEVIDPGAH